MALGPPGPRSARTARHLVTYTVVAGTACADPGHHPATQHRSRPSELADWNVTRLGGPRHRVRKSPGRRPWTRHEDNTPRPARFNPSPRRPPPQRGRPMTPSHAARARPPAVCAARSVSATNLAAASGALRTRIRMFHVPTRQSLRSARESPLRQQDATHQRRARHRRRSHIYLRRGRWTIRVNSCILGSVPIQA